MKLKPTDHIVIFIEKNDSVEDFLSKGWTEFICKATLCDHILLVNKLKNPDLTEIIDGVMIRLSIVPSSLVSLVAE